MQFSQNLLSKLHFGTFICCVIKIMDVRVSLPEKKRESKPEKSVSHIYSDYICLSLEVHAE